ncbi:MAG: capsule biosynthesis protein CapK [Prevotella sp.]|nr:capsule biosynthesis protein CapK [Prevotella sp.]
MEKIDFVVAWLDSSDPLWQQQYEHYKSGAKGDKSEARFRDGHIFNYWFRAVEKYAPWVNKVYLVTNGKFPDWINKDCSKLVLVSHADYMPAECLPTFNSCAIELHLHRIKGLSEQFVYFNDDMMLNGPVAPEYYFSNGLPCDFNKETCFNVPIYTQTERFNIYMSMLANLGIVNAHFDRWKTVTQSPRRWFGLHLGLKGLIMSLVLMKQRLFVGFSNFHTEQAYLKSTFEEVWAAEPAFLQESCTRFREEVIANPYLFRYWQFAKNMFYPMKRRFGTFHFTDKSVVDEIEKALFNPAISSVCLNDTPFCTDEDFEYINLHLSQMLEMKFPEKSQFER